MSTPNISDRQNRAMDHRIKPRIKITDNGAGGDGKVKPGDNLMLHKVIDVSRREISWS